MKHPVIFGWLLATVVWGFWLYGLIGAFRLARGPRRFRVTYFVVMGIAAAIGTILMVRYLPK